MNTLKDELLDRAGTLEKLAAQQREMATHMQTEANEQSAAAVASEQRAAEYRALAEKV
jgi:predicted secreted acid phosphatase